jgi:DNA-binding winged helix-turn-helix (wHTH) protein/Tfp pilus assembly protein PilF
MGEIERLPDAARIDLAVAGEFELGGMRVIPAERAIVLDDERIELQPRVMQVLVALAQARPGVVSRDKLVEQCWDGRVVGDDALNRCILALRNLAKKRSPEPFTIETVPRIGHRLIEGGSEPAIAEPAVKAKAWWKIALPVAILLAIAGFLWTGSQRRGLQTVLVEAASNDEASRALARDLAARIGSLQLPHSGSLRLLGERGRMAPDLVFRIASSSSGGRSASVTLYSGPGGAILWSQGFVQPAGRSSDLRQQIAYTTAQVLNCALEGRSSRDRLSEQAFKSYLNACATLSHEHDSRQTAQVLEGVVRASPRFAAGWARLLAAESDALGDGNLPEDQEGKERLKRHIAEARKVEPDLAEVHIAEAMLMPPGDFLARDRALSLAVEQNPNHSGARAARARFLQSVGRGDDAVQDAREAVKLDPLSPTIRDSYISTLMTLGRTDAAWQALEEAERIWPGAQSLLEARYRLHLRVGDPREALRILRSGGINTGGTDSQELLLQARIDPSKENIDRALRLDRNVSKEFPQAISFHAQALAEFGRTDELFEILLTWNRPDLVDWITDILFRPAFAKVHRDPRFLKAADRLGLLDYWLASGKWPDFCVAPDLTYDCKAEGRKIAAAGR